MKKLGLTIFFILILLLSVEVVADVYEGYRLHIDDVLSISVWGHPDLQREVLIRPDGKISFPLIGEIEAQGVTIEELNEVITEKLGQYIKDPQVDITLKKYRGLQVLVMGEVKNPGTYKLTLGGRVLDALSSAGGPTETADMQNVRLTREEESFLLDLEEVLTGQDLEYNYQLEIGDVLYIPRSTVEVTILGEVRQQGVYELKRGVRLSDLIAKAGGLLDTAERKAVHTSGPETKSIDLDKIFAGGSDSNPILKDGDTVYINKATYQVTVMGAVNKPGSYPWFEGLTLAEVIAQAGNVVEMGNMEAINIVSRDGSVASYNLKDYIEDGILKANPTLRAGDLVIVSTVRAIDWEFIFFFVRGLNAIKDFLDIQW